MPLPGRLKRKVAQPPFKSTITETLIHEKSYLDNIILRLLCCPVLKPQMTGVPGPCVNEIENVSVVQSPVCPPTKSFDGAASFVATTGLLIENI